MLRCAIFGLLPLIPACFAQTTTLWPDAAPAEDPQVRAEAVRLMERAVMLTTPVWGDNEEFFDFRVLHQFGEAIKGAIRIGVRTPMNKRWEFTYGPYRFIRVQHGDECATYRSQDAEPASLAAVQELLPAIHRKFDSSDIVLGIADATVDGRPARRIEFMTLKYGQQHSGQVCVDAQNGLLLLIRLGDQTIRQSAYFRFNDSWLPGRLEQSMSGEKTIEIDSKVAVRTEFPPEYFDYPAAAKIEHHACR